MAGENQAYQTETESVPRDVDPKAAQVAEMSEAEFSASVKSMIDDAVDYIDGFIAPDRANATAFYRGDPLGNEEEGRSQIVMTELRDVVLSMVPSLLRVFTGGERAVEYEPRKETDVEIAEQATDYINYVFYSDNSGFQILHDAFKDALIRRLGIIKWRWAEDKEISDAEYTGLDEGQYHLLVSDPTVEVVEEKKTVIQEAMQEPTTGVTVMPEIASYDVKIKRSTPKNKVCIECVPPEEFLISRDARDLDSAGYVGHRSLKTVSELVAMGYDQEEIEEYAGQGDVFVLNYEAQKRNPGIMSFMAHADNPDPAMRRLLYVESYIRIDRDGDGIAELRRVCTIGNAHHVLHDEVATDVPFATFCPDPEPHMVIGYSVANQVMDLQVLKSGIVRNVMDSLAQSIHPRTVVVEGQVNIDDVMNTETGAIIRARNVGAVQQLSEPFVGQPAMPILQYIDDIRAQRTGITKASQGLDPDVLQSTTKAAVTATVQASQERLEMIARIFAETGMKRLFRGLLKLLSRHQDQPRMVKLRGKWTPVDPRYWDADMNVVVNVGLGRGNEAERMQFLMMVAQKQEQIIQMLGPDNPLCDISQYRNTLGKILELASYKATTQFFKPVDAQTVQMMAQAAQQKPQADPNALLAQIEQAKAQVQAQKVQADAVIDQQRMALEREVEMLKDARERDKILADTALRAAELKAKYGAQVDVAHIENQFQHDREMALAAIDAATREREAQIKAAAQQYQGMNATQ